ncbi:glucosidase [Cryptococcus wingfieldii CBS 7118]|uniref:Glucosidase n=1 Tax=Cryptococcus wingfieldii CBS 7118 TaxID=1295528 RepID=A0A1E3HJ99_9TREE|nr:glucosidase [Cryptococcus wingfieldii CBS 7118]ODN76413.1 glucosidase [Cryptococcus wingfieldii CBS 7118]
MNSPTHSQSGHEPLLAYASHPDQHNSHRYSDYSYTSNDFGGMSHRNSGVISPSPSLPRVDSEMSHTSAYSANPYSGGGFGPTANVAGGVSTANVRGPLLRQAGAPANNQPMPSNEDDDLDDDLHTFTPGELRASKISTPFTFTSLRGWLNALTLFVLAGGGIMLFAGYPILTYYYGDDSSSGSATAGYNIGGVNASGQYPEIPGLPSMIDEDTPEWAHSRTGADGGEWTLVFSDEFEKEGRTFFEGDDPFFTAMDIHYWGTGDLEWLDPSAVTTRDGHLVMTMTQEPIHDLNFKSGMVQSWNKLCFNKNAFIEVSASFPGNTSLGGFWPGIWTMGNLGRPGYGATTDGTWPYSYDTCDIGTLPNQTWVNGTGPAATLNTGSNSGPLSFLPGQRISACTCEGEDHPGPSSNVGRSAPEIDIIEAQIILDEARGEVSQSLQIAPFDDHYQWNNASDNFRMYDTDLSYWNTYLGGTTQQALSSLTRVPRDIYYNQEGESGKFGVFGVEYQAFPDHREDGYITWYSDNKTSWTLYGGTLAPNNKTEIGQRMVPEEPLALIFNLHMSYNFQAVDLDHLVWPNYHRIDYIRVYQKPDRISVTCNPDDYPTAEYIENHLNAYSNPNLTTWEDAGYTYPKNRLIDDC